MALPSSPNQISFSQVQTEFGGSHPILLSEYYKDGLYVPSTIGSEAGAWGSWTTGNPGYNTNMHNIINTAYNYWIIFHNGTGVSGAGHNDNLQLDSNNMVVVGSYEYERATSYYFSYIPSKGNYDSYYSYHYHRRAPSTEETVNANIPTDGDPHPEISMNNMYEGRKT